MEKNLGPVINPYKKKKQRTINIMSFDGKYVTVDQDNATHMNMYFCEISEELRMLFRTRAVTITNSYQLRV